MLLFPAPTQGMMLGEQEEVKKTPAQAKWEAEQAEIEKERQETAEYFRMIGQLRDSNAEKGVRRNVDTMDGQVQFAKTMEKIRKSQAKRRAQADGLEWEDDDPDETEEERRRKQLGTQ
jgi:hypothetical protein